MRDIIHTNWLLLCILAIPHLFMNYWYSHYVNKLHFNYFMSVLSGSCNIGPRNDVTDEYKNTFDRIAREHIATKHFDIIGVRRRSGLYLHVMSSWMLSYERQCSIVHSVILLFSKQWSGWALSTNQIRANFWPWGTAINL